MNIRKYSDTNIIPFFCCIMQLVVGGLRWSTISIKFISLLAPTPLTLTLWCTISPLRLFVNSCKYARHAHINSQGQDVVLSISVSLFGFLCSSKQTFMATGEEWMMIQCANKCKPVRYLNMIISMLAEWLNIVILSDSLVWIGVPIVSQYLQYFSQSDFFCVFFVCVYLSETSVLPTLWQLHQRTVQ